MRSERFCFEDVAIRPLAAAIPVPRPAGLSSTTVPGRMRSFPAFLMIEMDYVWREGKFPLGAKRNALNHRARAWAPIPSAPWMTMTGMARTMGMTWSRFSCSRRSTNFPAAATTTTMTSPAAAFEGGRRAPIVDLQRRFGIPGFRSRLLSSTTLQQVQGKSVPSSETAGPATSGIKAHPSWPCAWAKHRDQTKRLQPLPYGFDAPRLSHERRRLQTTGGSPRVPESGHERFMSSRPDAARHFFHPVVANSQRL